MLGLCFLQRLGVGDVGRVFRHELLEVYLQLAGGSLVGTFDDAIFIDHCPGEFLIIGYHSDYRGIDLAAVFDDRFGLLRVDVLFVYADRRRYLKMPSYLQHPVQVMAS